MLARVTDAGGRAELRVESVLRGRCGRTLNMVARGVNDARAVDEPRFKVEEGERAIFVLVPWTDDRGDVVSDDVYMPVRGWAGKIPIPAEGGQALVEAVREIIRYQDTDDGAAGVVSLTRWISGTNPWLIEAALEEAARLGLADARMARGLIARAADPNPLRRARVAEALGTALARGHLDPQPNRAMSVPGQDAIPAEAREIIVRFARTDPDPTVRRAAVAQLGSGQVPEARTVLLAIVRDDASQEVRYEAASALANLDQIARQRGTGT